MAKHLEREDRSLKQSDELGRDAASGNAARLPRQICGGALQNRLAVEGSLHGSKERGEGGLNGTDGVDSGQ